MTRVGGFVTWTEQVQSNLGDLVNCLFKYVCLLNNDLNNYKNNIKLALQQSLLVLYRTQSTGSRHPEHTRRYLFTGCLASTIKWLPRRSSKNNRIINQKEIFINSFTLILDYIQNKLKCNILNVTHLTEQSIDSVFYKRFKFDSLVID